MASFGYHSAVSIVLKLKDRCHGARFRDIINNFECSAWPIIANDRLLILIRIHIVDFADVIECLIEAGAVVTRVS